MLNDCGHSTGCVICNTPRPDTVQLHRINGLVYHHDCAEDRSADDFCPSCEEWASR